MDNIRRRPPMEGFQGGSRTGGGSGEPTGNDDTVEGHIMNMKYKANPDDDVEGHGWLKANPDDEDVEGHGFGKGQKTTPDEDDTEGHGPHIR
jgi:hypothetical protein